MPGAGSPVLSHNKMQGTMQVRPDALNHSILRDKKRHAADTSKASSSIDQGTTNGTFVNDIRYGQISKAVLENGDTVIVSEPDCLSLTL
jgi:hypothetical protein